MNHKEIIKEATAGEITVGFEIEIMLATLAQEYVVVAESPDKKIMFAGSPGISRLPNGCLLASYEWFRPKPYTQTIPFQTEVKVSKDGGKKDYEVGYGKPPRYTQFGAENGNKRNKKGRPPGRNILEFDRLSEEALWHCFHESAQKPVSIVEDGQEMVIPLIMAITKSMAKDAAQGDKYARRDYLKYLEKAVKGNFYLFFINKDLCAWFSFS